MAPTADDDADRPSPAPVPWTVPGAEPADVGDASAGDRREPSAVAGPSPPAPPPSTAPPPGYGPPPGDGPPPGYGPPPGWGSPSGSGQPSGWGPPPALPKAGDARTGPLPLHPMTVSDILDGAFRLMKANARTVFPIVAVFVVPLQVLAAFAQRNLFGGAALLDAMSDPSLLSDDTFQTDADALVGIVAGLLNILVLPFLAGAISQVVAASYLGREMGAVEALRTTLGRAWALFGGWIVVHLLEAAGFIVAAVAFFALAVGGAPEAGLAVAVIVGLFTGVPLLLIVLGLSVVVAPAIVVERLGPVAGTKRSWSLVRRRFWAVLGTALLAGFIASILGQILGFIPSVAGLLVGLQGGWILLAFGAILTALVTQPIVAIVATLQYFDLRIRFEGFDLEVIASELSSAGSRR